MCFPPFGISLLYIVLEVQPLLYVKAIVHSIILCNVLLESLKENSALLGLEVVSIKLGCQSLEGYK